MLKKINVNGLYNCYIGKDILGELDIKSDIDSILNKTHKVLFVKDSKISNEYLKKISKLFNGYFLYYYELEVSEENKSIDEYINIQNYLLANSFSRNDCIVAIGGGVTTDLVGFVASTFKRGMIDIYFPTTTLSMIDASIGGKCAINHNGIKNVIGTFYNPTLVVMDVESLESLDKRDYNSGLVEGIKMGLTLNKDLYNLFKEEKIDIEKIIELSILTKNEIVSQDYNDKSKREILNFGHTIAHAIELKYNYLHGECVAFGMINNILNEELKGEVKELLLKLAINIDEMAKTIDIKNLDLSNDKKNNGGILRESYLNAIEDYEIKEIEL